MSLNKLLKFISTDTLSAQELQELFYLAEEGSSSRWQKFSRALSGKVVGLLFFNPSLRTRCSLQSGIARLGGDTVVISPQEVWPLEYSDGAIMNSDKSEHVKDGAMVLSSYFDLVGVRSFPKMLSFEEDRADTVINSFSKHLKVPFINLESSLWHPCQALADAFTLWKRFNGQFKGKKFVLSWANHPKQLPMAVPNSAALMAAQLGMDLTIVCPEQYQLSDPVNAAIQTHAKLSGGSLTYQHSQEEAFSDADVVYAKSWTPAPFVGKAEDELRHRAALSNWIVTEDLMARTNNGAFMHCLPVRRNVVVTDSVLDSRQSLISTQVINRMHMQNALILKALGVTQ